MHSSVARWIARKVDEHDLAKLTTLEIGSYNVNGSIRGYWAGDYVGLDMRDGPDVDLVASSHEVPYWDEAFDCIVSCEMLEHDEAPWATMTEIGRLLRPEGWCLLTARGFGFPLHDHPADYFRYTVGAFESLFRLAGLTPVEIIPDPDENQPGVFGVARKVA